MHFLSSHIMDPMLYVIVAALCSIRRLFHNHRGVASEIWTAVVRADPPKGPASALARHLNKVSWHPAPGGLVTLPSGHQLRLTEQSTTEIRDACRAAWSYHVHSQIGHRKGVTGTPFDEYTAKKLFSRLSPREQRLLSLNITGGFQLLQLNQFGITRSLPSVLSVDSPIHTCIAFWNVHILPMLESTILRQFAFSSSVHTLHGFRFQPFILNSENTTFYELAGRVPSWIRSTNPPNR